MTIMMWNLTPSINKWATITQVYWAGPIIGGIVAALFYSFIMRAPRPAVQIRPAVPLGPEDPAQEAILNHDQDKEVIVDRTTNI